MATCPDSGKALAASVIAPLAGLLLLLAVAKCLSSLLSMVVVGIAYWAVCKAIFYCAGIPERRLERRGTLGSPLRIQEEPAPTESKKSGPWLTIID